MEDSPTVPYPITYLNIYIYRFFYFFQASAHENVNVDAAFFAVAQLVDRSRGRTRILSYYEAAMGRRQMMDEATVKISRNC